MPPTINSSLMRRLTTLARKKRSYQASSPVLPVARFECSLHSEIASSRGGAGAIFACTKAYRNLPPKRLNLSSIKHAFGQASEKKKCSHSCERTALSYTIQGGTYGRAKQRIRVRGEP